MATDYILVDYENVQPRDVPLLDIARHRVTILRGSHQTKLDFALAETLQPLGRSVEYMRVEKAGKNALDFQLAFHAGRLLERHASANGGGEARFVIVSNDTGYDALLLHIQALGYVAVKAASMREALAVSKPVNGGADAVARARQHLQKNPANRPATRAALLRNLTAHFKGTPEVDVEAVVKTLEQRGDILTAGTKVEYLLLA